MSLNGISREELKEILCIEDKEFTSLLSTFNLDYNTDFFNKKLVGTMISFLNKSWKQIVVDLDKINFSIAPVVRKSLMELMSERKSNKNTKIQVVSESLLLSKMEKIILKEHQTEAVSSTLDLLEDEDKAQIISACGTGKTYIAKRIIEKHIDGLSRSISVIFLPSLALIAQTYNSWKSCVEYPSHSQPLIICSDDDIVSDGELQLDKEEFPFSINTSPVLTRDFLDNEALEHKLIFCTYQSANILGEALLHTSYAVDIAIFDEAHKTSGFYDKDFAYSLFDKNIRIKKRVFMTATQKNYFIDTDGNNEILSMDNAEIYGKVSYHLSMREAIRMGLIKDYKIAIVTISSDMVHEAKGYLQKNNKQVVTKQDLIAYAFLKLINEKQISKSILFHSTIAESKKFINNEIIKNGLGGNICHIDGYMNSKSRNNIIAKLHIREELHISNSRLFSEGVDIPSVNMVGLLNPSKSVVDVVQRLGRMQRKEHPDDNESGVLFLPLFLDEAKNLLDMGDTFYNDWNYIVDILSYLKESDEQIKIIFENAKEDEKISKPKVLNRLKNIADILHDKKDIDTVLNDVVFNNIVRHMQIKLYSQTRDMWDIWFTKAGIYSEKHNGDFPTASECQKGNEYYNLGVWLKAQRGLLNKGLLSKERIEKLKDFE